MKKNKNKKDKQNKENKENKEKLRKPHKDINDLIDELAYGDEKGNIKKSKKILDDIYILSQE